MTGPYLLVEGPDGCGKTEIARDLATELKLAYFKVDSERKNWDESTFKSSLWFDFTLPQFLWQAKVPGVVFDRSYGSEWVYSRVFERETNVPMLERTDFGFSGVGAIQVVLLRRDYRDARQDDLVAPGKLPLLHEAYLKFIDWTRCDVVTMRVDDFGNDIVRQRAAMLPAIRRIWMTPGANKQRVDL